MALPLQQKNTREWEMSIMKSELHFSARYTQSDSVKEEKSGRKEKERREGREKREGERRRGRPMA